MQFKVLIKIINYDLYSNQRVDKLYEYMLIEMPVDVSFVRVKISEIKKIAENLNISKIFYFHSPQKIQIEKKNKKNNKYSHEKGGR